MKEPIRYSPALKASLPDLIQSVKVQGLERLVAKRLESRHEPGRRSGAWQKMRVNQGQEFVIGGYTPGPKNFDALILNTASSLWIKGTNTTKLGYRERQIRSLAKKAQKLGFQLVPAPAIPAQPA